MCEFIAQQTEVGLQILDVYLILKKVRDCSETYDYYSLPFCADASKEYKVLSFGEALAGRRLVTTPYSIPFRVDIPHQALCSHNASAADMSKLRDAISKGFYVQVGSRPTP
jgi:hypothetical protein